MTIAFETCAFPPFRYQSVPQPVGDAGSSSNQINEQALEGYLFRLVGALCRDLQAIDVKLVELEARIEVLEP